jgi:DNA-binding NarL/FixJ family response regulator
MSLALLSSVLDGLPCAVFVLDGAGSVIYANRAARAAVDTLLRNPGEACREAVAIASAVREAGREQRTLIVESAHGPTVWRGRIWQLEGEQVAFQLHAEVRRKGDIALLVRSFALEPQEARLASRVAEGMSNQEIAQLWGIPLGTVKTRLWNLYRKVGVRSRAELAVRVTGCLSELAPPDSNGGATPSG